MICDMVSGFYSVSFLSLSLGDIVYRSPETWRHPRVIATVGNMIDTHCMLVQSCNEFPLGLTTLPFSFGSSKGQRGFELPSGIFQLLGLLNYEERATLEMNLIFWGDYKGLQIKTKS